MNALSPSLPLSLQLPLYREILTPLAPLALGALGERRTPITC